MEPFFEKTFWITVFILWVALVLLYFILTSKKALQRKGHHEKYIAYLRKSHLIRISLIAVLLPLLMLLSGWIVFRITGRLDDEAQLAYTLIVLIILVVPFKFLDERINQKRIRELAIETGEKIAIDLNYKTLHLIFNPRWELVLGPASLAYGILFLHIQHWVVYLFLLFPWFMYLNIRGTRYQTRPYLIDNYKYMFTFNIYSFLFFLFFFCSFYILKIREFVTGWTTEGRSGFPGGGFPTLFLLAAGGLLILALLARTAIYLANYRPFNKTMNGERITPGSQVLRKLAFFGGGVVLLFTLSGAALITGFFQEGRFEVGVVREKFVIDERLGTGDTVLVVDRYHGESLEDLAWLPDYDHLEMSCNIRLSRTSQVRSYSICCPSTFKELPVGSIVKFEVGQGSTITRLIEY